jgi:predicted transcriptional regulator
MTVNTTLWMDIMAENSVLTVRLPDDDMKRLDRLAAQRRQTRSQLVQQTLRTLLENDEEQRLRQIEGLRERLRPAIVAQNNFLDHVSIADEHRSF